MDGLSFKVGASMVPLDAYGGAGSSSGPQRWGLLERRGLLLIQTDTGAIWRIRRTFPKRRSTKS